MPKLGQANRDIGKFPPDTGCGGLCVKSLECPYPVCILDSGGLRKLKEPQPQQATVKLAVQVKKVRQTVRVRTKVHYTLGVWYKVHPRPQNTRGG